MQGEHFVLVQKIATCQRYFAATSFSASLDLAKLSRPDVFFGHTSSILLFTFCDVCLATMPATISDIVECSFTGDSLDKLGTEWSPQQPRFLSY